MKTKGLKKQIVYSLSLAVCVGALGCTKKLDTDTKKASYGIGLQLGKNIKSQFPDFDADAVALGMKDAGSDKPKVTEQEIRDAMMKMQMAAAEKQQKESAGNLQAAKEFLDKNKTAEGVKVTKTGLQYIIEKEGAGKTPKATDVVKVNYKGTLLDGKVFDSSYDRGTPAELPLNAVIPGWTEGLQLLKVGGKMKLFIPPELGYGNMARPSIPAGSALIFELELLDIVKQ